MNARGGIDIKAAPEKEKDDEYDDNVSLGSWIKAAPEKEKDDEDDEDDEDERLASLVYDVLASLAAQENLAHLERGDFVLSHDKNENGPYLVVSKVCERNWDGGVSALDLRCTRSQYDAKCITPVGRWHLPLRRAYGDIEQTNLLCKVQLTTDGYLSKLGSPSRVVEDANVFDELQGNNTDTD